MTRSPPHPVIDDPVAFSVTAQGVAARLSACAPHQTVRVGLLVNPRAGRAKHARMRRQLQAELGNPHAWAETYDLASIRRALAQLLCVYGANVLAIAGGDGTVHHAVNALLALSREAAISTGTEPPLPRILILNGGTLNIVGRTCAIHGPPIETLRKFLRYFAGAPLSRVPSRRLPLLEVAWHGAQGPQDPPRYGFVFGSEVAYHAIELYERFGAGYGGLLRFLAELSRGIVTGSELWQREGWKLGPYLGGLQVDETCWPAYTGVAAATVDLTLAIGAARAIRRQLYQPGFSVRVVEETDPRGLIALLPALMNDKQVKGVRDFPSVARMTLRGPYTLDGELFHEPARGAEPLRLTVSLSGYRLHAVPGEWSADEW